MILDDIQNSLKKQSWEIGCDKRYMAEGPIVLDAPMDWEIAEGVHLMLARGNSDFVDKWINFGEAKLRVIDSYQGAGLRLHFFTTEACLAFCTTNNIVFSCGLLRELIDKKKNIHATLLEEIFELEEVLRKTI